MGDLLTSGPVTVDLTVPASALAIGAHPDDIEFGCGATLAKWAAGGCRLHHLVLTDGSKGSWDPDADLVALVSARRRECRAAADVIDGGAGAASGSDDRVILAGQVDGELENGVDQRREVARIIRTVRPTVVLGHDPWRRYRLHPDHRAAGFLTVDALVAARDPHFFPELALAPHRPEVLLLFEADLPNHLEDARGIRGEEDRRPAVPSEPVGDHDGHRSGRWTGSGWRAGPGRNSRCGPRSAPGIRLQGTTAAGPAWRVGRARSSRGLP